MTEGMIVYYSRTGTVRQVAEALAEQLGWPVAEVADETSRAGFGGDLRCVLDIVLHRAARYRFSGPDPADCNHVVVLAPVWLGRLATPMRSFLADYAATLSHVEHLSAICVMAARGGYRAMAEVNQLTGKIPTPALVLLQRDVLSGTATLDIDYFAQTLRLADPDMARTQRPAWLSPNTT